jgi:hypothetical protein
MNQPLNVHRRTLRREFRDSYRAGPRVWRLAAVIFLCVVAFPVFGWLALLFALLFVLPAIAGGLLGRLISSFRDARILRRLQAPQR